MSQQLLTLPNRRNQITQKVWIPGRTLYISVNDDSAPAGVLLLVKGVGCERYALMPTRRILNNVRRAIQSIVKPFTDPEYRLVH
jgi:hypothetical protein